MKLNRRGFLTMTGAMGLASGRVFSAAETPARRGDKSGQPGAPEGKAVKSRIRVAQIKVFPQKGRMAANHMKLMSVLGDIERAGKVDVITEIDLSKAPANNGGHIADRRPDVYGQ
jgi:hypothetical protein